jgi:hypothetical protein
VSDAAQNTRLFIHIGTHRTATTSIQSYLYENRRALIDKGFLYPFDMRRHAIFFRKVADGRINTVGLADRILSDFERLPTSVRNVIVSDEDISFYTDYSILADLKKDFDLHFILYMRRQDLWLESWYLQNIKWQFDQRYRALPFADFYAKRADFHWMHYDRVVAQLEALVPKENIHLTVFERDQMPGGPVATFARAVGLTDTEGFQAAEHKNSSMSPLMTEYLRHLPLHEASAPFRGFIESACARVDAADPGRRPGAIYMAPAERAQYLSNFAEGNAALARKYFGRDQLFLEPLPPADAPMAFFDLPKDSATLLEKFVGPMVAEMIAARNRNESLGKAD